MTVTPPKIADIAAHHDQPAMACWACGRYRRAPERAHIVPRSVGGSNTDPANYVLLCSGCHLAAPDVRDPDEMWEWIEQQPNEVDMIVDALYPEISAHPDLTLEQISATARHVLRTDATCHQGYSPSTIAWVLKTAVRRACPCCSAALDREQR